MICLNCEQCQSEFQVKNYRKNTARFCSRTCSGKWALSVRKMVGQSLKGNKLRSGLRPSNAFQKGYSPWNKNKKGIHLSPKSEFKKGRESNRKLLVGSITVRTDKNGAKRQYIKIADPNSWKLLCVYNWEKENGKVPDGYILHHIDHNSMNDDVNNLKALTRSEHIKEHADDLHHHRMIKKLEKSKNRIDKK